MVDWRVSRAGGVGRGRWMSGRRGRLALGLLAIGCVAAAAAIPAVQLVSVSMFGTTGNAPSSNPAVNADGTFVAFASDATNLVPRDTNEYRDVFVRDLTAQTTERVSVDSAGAQANGPSQAQGDAPGISANGNIVAFYSDATNLVHADTNGQPDVFVRVCDADSTALISSGADGAPANGPSLFPSISADGRFVAFQSLATNLVAAAGNGQADIYVRDRVSDTTVRACPDFVRHGPSIAPSISADGTAVAFAAADTALAPASVNRFFQIYVCVLQSGTVSVASVNDAGALGDADSFLPALNQDGTLVAFKSSADNLVPNDHNGLVDVFARNLTASQTERISVSVAGGDPNELSFPPAVDYEGRFVAFGSFATNLVPNDFNQESSVFVRDRVGGVTFLGDVNDRGEQGNGGVPDDPPALSGDGRSLSYASTATNLAPNDRDPMLDVFIGRNPFACDDDEDCPPGFVCFEGFCELLGTPTPTPTPGPNDCCQCPGPLCEAPGATGCPANCEAVYQALCQEGISCVTFTPTPTPTASLTPTPTPTPGPNDCCQCPGPLCEAPGATGCPESCEAVYSALCEGGTNCVTFTPTPTATATPTPGPNDCCQCPGPLCEAPGAAGCPANCEAVYSALCEGGTNCVTLTPTPTPTATPTPGPNDCCQCPGPLCEAPGATGCPANCEAIYKAVCEDGTTCVTVTPGVTVTPTPTPTTTPTAGARDCCQCGANQCQAPGATGCPAQCDVVRDATCVDATTCATFTPTATLTPTPTPTRTPTAGARDCCQCGGNRCEAPGNDGCPVDCDIVRDAACIDGTTCTAFTPTLTPTRTQPPSPTRTPTRRSKFDDDGCRLSPRSDDGGSGTGLLWLMAPAALLLWRRRVV